VLRAFVDGSKAHGTLAVAGFLGHAQQWSDFQKAWRTARSQAGVPYLHTTDLKDGRAKPYRDWSQRKKDAIQSNLVRKINAAAAFGFAAAIDLRQFSTLQTETTVNNPFLFCAAVCIYEVARFLRYLGMTEEVAYVFEAGDEGEATFRTAMSRIVKSSSSYRKRVHVFSIQPGTKAQVPALDAADFLAWHSTRIVKAKESAEEYGDPYFARLTIPLEGAWFNNPESIAYMIRNNPERAAAFRKEFGIRLGGTQRKRFRRATSDRTDRRS
jgi:hypothetical protein